MHTYIHTSIHTYIQYKDTYINTYIHTHIHTLHTYIHTLQTYIHKFIRPYIHTYIRPYIHTYVTYIHTHIHTYIHTYIHILTLNYIDGFKKSSNLISCKSVPLDPNCPLRTDRPTEKKIGMKKLEDDFHCFPDMSEKGNHNFRTTAKFTLNYHFRFVCPSVSLSYNFCVFSLPDNRCASFNG